MIFANINYLLLLFVLRALIAGTVLVSILSVLHMFNLVDNQNTLSLGIIVVTIIVIIYSVYQVYNKKDLLPVNYKNNRKITAGLVIVFLGHLSTTSMFILIQIMKAGSASGFFLLPSLLFSAVFYLIGGIMVINGINRLGIESS